MSQPTYPPGAIMTEDGRIAVAECPDCKTLSVINPAWLQCVGTTIRLACDNCCEEMDTKVKNHKILQFNLQP